MINEIPRRSETKAIAQKIHKILERGIFFFSIIFHFSSRNFSLRNAFSQRREGETFVIILYTFHSKIYSPLPS